MTKGLPISLHDLKGVKRWYQKIFLYSLLSMQISSTVCQSAEKTSDMLSVSQGAFAANAGGQNAYSLRYFHAGNEFQVFANKSLTAGGLPLFGAGYGPRFNGCQECFWKPFIQTGAGFTNAGPFVELDWGITIPVLPIWLPMDPPKFVPQLRVDFATHLIFGQIRPSIWSYPLWLGIAVPF